ncbi:MAG TPA: hypothetical protein VJ501_00085 [Burkholderiaceae bacterium]|nr:hypothetical protein [Burkholderiaceae bacterium]
MKNTLLAAALLAICAWTAVASAQPPPLVTVTLVGEQIQVDVDPVVIQRRMGRNIVIRWQLAPGADYRFEPEGIVINGELTGGGGLKAEQDQLPRSCRGGPNHVTCVNQNSRSGQFKYTIHLLDRNNRPVARDPIIVNQ